MTDYLELSYTGDLLAHRRCARAWAYEKHVGFHPYEQVQAMEGRLVHHAMDWLARQYRESGQHPSAAELDGQLNRQFRVLWARGIRTTFASKSETVARVLSNLYEGGEMNEIVRAAIEGAVHTEYEIRAVRKLLPAEFDGKQRVLLTGILDLVVQQERPLTYRRGWHWSSLDSLEGQPVELETHAQRGDVEIWDYKGTRADHQFLPDFVRQVLTYAALFEERWGSLPVRCVLYFINERDRNRRLLAIDVDRSIVDASVEWTMSQVKALYDTRRQFETDPRSVSGGELEAHGRPPEDRVSPDLAQQCTACGQRFDCDEYRAYLSSRPRGGALTDIDIRNIRKN